MVSAIVAPAKAGVQEQPAGFAALDSRSRGPLAGDSPADPRRGNDEGDAFRSLFASLIAILLATLLASGTAPAADRFITVASTTSTQNSGLFEHLLPQFTRKSGIEVRVIAVGTGQAIKLAEKGDADVLLVHHKPSEEKFVADGFGVKRLDVMYNDFVIVGPKTDPADVKGLKDASAAFKRVAEKKAMFASRSDDSGTHKLELELWKAAQIDPKAHSGVWYRELGSGMGATLNTATGLSAHALSDRASWSQFKNKGDLAILVEGDPRLVNQYGVILVNPAKRKHIKAKDGQAFVDWLVSADGQKTIADYKIGGEQGFFPNAAKATN
ncbi:MAG: sulfate transporter [Rhodospirillales bacterium]|nr:sulfate transporter [Rhodospirillales bacterium]